VISKVELWLRLVVVGIVSSFSMISWAEEGKVNKTAPEIYPTVEIEEVVTRYSPANNGAGPMWCYGSTVVARQGDEVYLSVIETGKDVPPLCNTRWQLWQKSSSGWQLRQNEKDYRQREPCPVGVFHDGSLFLSVNPSTQPSGVKYGACRPLVLEFDPGRLAVEPKTHVPVWAEGTNFTDHSYRGFGADGKNRELLLLNINSKTSEQFVSYYTKEGNWQEKGTIKFPIRACYPQVALRDQAAHVLAIGDIVEPVEEWRKLKIEKLNRKWDYVFRRLFYTFTPDIRTTKFAKPIEVDSVEKTAGHITNLDLYIDDTGSAHLLYLKRPHHYSFLRDKYFPGQPITIHLEYAVLKEGMVQYRQTLAESVHKKNEINPAYARFHVTEDESIYVMVAGTTIDESGKSVLSNFIGQVSGESQKPDFTALEMKHPFRSFMTNTVRGGSKPTNIIDIFGIADDSPNLRYARVRLKVNRTDPSSKEN
jgi:hypothetical protein